VEGGDVEGGDVEGGDAEGGPAKGVVKSFGEEDILFLFYNIHI
jgi:hypothetical protein